MTVQDQAHRAEQAALKAIDHLPVKQLLLSPFTLPWQLPGMAKTTWRYLGSTRRMMHHRQVDVHGPVGGPDPDRRHTGDDTAVQRRREGFGPVYHRIYCLEVDDATMTPEQLIAHLLADPNDASPTEVATFEKQASPRGEELGEEFEIHLPGPWEAPVRVISRTATSFTFATLKGHMEAGEIEFRSSRTDDGRLMFTIESWARSGDALFHLLYHHLWLGREMQMHMWVAFCLAAAEISGGLPHDRVLVTSYRYVDGGV